MIVGATVGGSGSIVPLLKLEVLFGRLAGAVLALPQGDRLIAANVAGL